MTFEDALCSQEWPRIGKSGGVTGVACFWQDRAVRAADLRVLGHQGGVLRHLEPLHVPGRLQRPTQAHR